MLTIAEKIADAIVNRFYEDMNNPEFRGPRFNQNTFNIERHVDVHLFLYYSKKGYPTAKVRKRAIKRSRKLWNKLWNIEANSCSVN